MKHLLFISFLLLIPKLALSLENSNLPTQSRSGAQRTFAIIVGGSPSKEDNSYSIILASLNSGNIAYHADIKQNETSIIVPSDNLASGHYVLTCTLNGKIINSYKFIKP